MKSCPVHKLKNVLGTAMIGHHFEALMLFGKEDRVGVAVLQLESSLPHCISVSLDCVSPSPLCLRGLVAVCFEFLQFLPFLSLSQSRQTPTPRQVSQYCLWLPFDNKVPSTCMVTAMQTYGYQQRAVALTKCHYIGYPL